MIGICIFILRIKIRILKCKEQYNIIYILGLSIDYIFLIAINRMIAMS